MKLFTIEVNNWDFWAIKNSSLKIGDKYEKFSWEMVNKNNWENINTFNPFKHFSSGSMDLKLSTRGFLGSLITNPRSNSEI